MNSTRGTYIRNIKSAGLFGGVQIINIIIGLLKTKFVALLLGTNGFGMFSIYNSIVRMSGDITGLGIQTSGVKKISNYYEQGNEKLDKSIISVRSWSIFAALCGFIITLVMSPLFNFISFGRSENHLFELTFIPFAVSLTTLSGGEIAILKGTGKQSKLAKLMIAGTVISLIISILLLYTFGAKAIVPSLVLSALFIYLLCCRATGLRFSNLPSINDILNCLKGDISLLKLGIAFSLACLAGSGTEYTIRSFLSTNASLEIVGLYNAGFMITMTYSGVAFSALEADYFPRLARNCTIGSMMGIINRQIITNLLIALPLLLVFMPLVSHILPILFSHNFIGAVSFVKVALFGVIARAVYLPIEYVALAQGKSLLYLFQESVSAILLLASSILGYHIGGLIGLGIGTSISAFMELLFVVVYTHYTFGYKPSMKVIFGTMASFIMLYAMYVIIE
ncbi:oligosaccharide flippase family protein [Prevotella sp.]|uniref:oligosaccharide flippase family protein n=1 Tax=Prevotella sp. TaxID=59823 RepID=UPI0026488C0E|nr:oligosaccharide flippase family protein [Prevotella sp.]MDN5554020.1 oligosaccharide flippase family protein [Prevotella sp.]